MNPETCMSMNMNKTTPKSLEDDADVTPRIPDDSTVARGRGNVRVVSSFFCSFFVSFFLAPCWCPRPDRIVLKTFGKSP